MKKNGRWSPGKKLLLCLLTASILMENIGIIQTAYAMEMEAEPQQLEEIPETDVDKTDEEKGEAKEKTAEEAKSEDMEKTEEAGGEAEELLPEELEKRIEEFPKESALWWQDAAELAETYETFMELCDRCEELSEEQQKQVDMGKLEAAGQFFAAWTDPVSLVNTGDIGSIPSEYGAGLIYRGKRSTAIYGPGWLDGRYAQNYAKDPDIYIRYPESGSCYVDGRHTQVDVVVYYWLTEGEAFVADRFGEDQVSIGSPAWCGYKPQDFTIEMEYHFFRAGTDEELAVNGYLFAHDLDMGEGICGKTGARGYYTSENTTMKWKGQYVTGTVDDDRSDYSMSVGVAFHSDPSAPFHVSYHGCEYYTIELSSVGVDGQLPKSYGNLQVTKRLVNGGSYATSPAGFSIRLRGTSAYGDAVDKTVVTDASGQAFFSGIPMGTYTVTEQGAASWWAVPAGQTVNIEPGQTTSCTVSNIYKTGNVEIQKKIETAPDAAYNAEAEEKRHYNTALSGFAYRLSGTADSGAKVLRYGATDTAGRLVFSDVPVGTYRVQEVKASEVPAAEACKKNATQELFQYVIPGAQTVKVTYDTAGQKGNTVRAEFQNRLKKWKFSGKRKKTDQELLKDGVSQGDATLAGAVYGLYDGGKLVATATTDEQGQFDFGGPYVAGDLWYVQEISASEGYLLNPARYEVKACAAEQGVGVETVFHVEFKDAAAGKTGLPERVKKQSLSFYKVTGTDRNDRLDPLTGATFSVYLVSELAKGRYAELEDAQVVQAVIDDYRDPTALDYGAMKEIPAVAELTSDSRGVVTTPKLPWGRYVVVETGVPADKTAARPFVFRVSGDEQDGTTDGDGKGESLSDLVILMDRQIQSLIRIRKMDQKSKNPVLKEGASYVIHDVEGAWFDYYTAEMTTAQKKAYRKQYGDLVVQYSQGVYTGTKEKPYVTRQMGTADQVYVETPGVLPAGLYELEELAAPEGYVLQGHEGVIAKKGGASGNGTFYETEETGKWTDTPQGRTRFQVSSDEARYDREIGAFVTEVRQQNEPAVGKIAVYAEGEKLTGAKKQVGTEDYRFVYEEKPVEGAQFEIRAAEDIYSPEGGENRTLIFHSGEMAATLVTDEKGQAWTGQEDWEGTEVAKGLPLGRYEIVQTAAGTGFALSAENQKPRAVELTYAGQEVPVVYRDGVYQVPRQKVQVEVEKLDAEKETALAGAVFGLYTAETITDWRGRELLKEGTLLGTAETTENSEGQVQKAVFGMDLPLGSYYVEELQAPKGYLKSEIRLSVDAAWRADQREVVQWAGTIRNQPVLVQINLMDYHTEQELTGAVLRITDETGQRVAEVETIHDQNPVIRGLEPGRSYLVEKLSGPEGYEKALTLKEDYVTEKKGAVELPKTSPDGETVRFTVQKEERLQVVSVFDKPLNGELVLEKTGEVPVGTKKGTDENGNPLLNPVYEVRGLPGAEYVLLAQKTIPYPDGFTGNLAEAGEKVLERYENEKDGGWKYYSLKVEAGELAEVREGTAVSYVLRTDETGRIRVTGLPAGAYEAVEVKAPTGYYRDTAACRKSFAIEDTAATVTFENERQGTRGENGGVRITKYSVDGDERRPVSGAAFTIYAAETVENILGQTVYTEGTAIETALSGPDGVARFQTDFPLGAYVVRETKAPAGHYSSTKEIHVDLTAQKDDDSIRDLSLEDYVENAITSVRVKLVDDQTKQELAGAALQITDSVGQPVEAWITETEGGYLIKGLQPEVDYQITEVLPRDGYRSEFTGASMKSENASMEKTEGSQVRFRLRDVPGENGAEGLLNRDTIPAETEILLENPFAVGQVRIHKTGEILENRTLVEKVKGLLKTCFHYQEKGLAGVAFEVRAAEDILHPDGVTGVVFRKGEQVCTDVRGIPEPAAAVTDEDGSVAFADMYPGSYELVETKTAQGYVRSGEPTAFRLVYRDGTVLPVSGEEALQMRNRRQRAEISVQKTDRDTGKPLAGAVIGLYTAEAIREEGGKVLLPADTLLETATTGENGQAVFEADLPLGMYYVREEQAPEGYERNEERQSFAFAYAGDSVETVKIALQIQDRKLPEQQASSGSGIPGGVLTGLTGADTSDRMTALPAIGGILLALSGCEVIRRRKRRR